ncbi:13.88 kDa late protein [Serratia phage Tsm2]|uniref:13.88 kDa late protein n=1 Tax=Serratia phage Tsm2 TaxID=2787014 RepID=A0A7S9XEY0_9CAUD|nr:13.88 kDa late protein [Serratia phage Tsm2]QPI13703.1 13.88 kDa late protein [Serratia phage Tsm2]
MLDKFLALLERFVVAHELIAANSGSRATGLDPATAAPYGKEEQPAPAAEDKPKRGRKPAAKKDPEPEPEDEPKPKRGRKAAADDVDYAALREQIADIDDALNDGDSNEAVDEFDDLMDEYGAKKLKDLQDEDLEAFLKAAKKIVNKYYEEE